MLATQGQQATGCTIFFCKRTDTVDIRPSAFHNNHILRISL